MSEKITATLISGLSYTQMIPNPDSPKEPKSISFVRNEPKEITQALRELLEEEAVEEVSLTGGGHTTSEVRCKFRFSDEEPAVSTPRRRRASPAAQAESA